MIGVRNTLINSKGFSLNETLIAMAVGGFVLMGTIQTVQILSKTTRNAETLLTRSGIQTWLLTSVDCAASEAANQTRLSQTVDNGGCTDANVLSHAPMQLVDFSGSELISAVNPGTKRGKFNIKVECGDLVPVTPATIPPTFRYNGYVIRAAAQRNNDLNSTNPADFFPHESTKAEITWLSPQTLLVPRGVASIVGFAGPGTNVERAAICGPNDIARRLSSLTNRVGALEAQLEAVRADLQTKIDVLRADLTTVNNDLQAYKGTNNAEVDALKARALALEARVALIDNNLRGGRGNDYAATYQIATLRQEIDTLKDQVDNLINPLRQNIPDRLARIETALDASLGCMTMGAYYAVGAINRSNPTAAAICKRLPVPGDFNNDGYSDIVTGAGAGGSPHVRVFSGNPNVSYVNGPPEGLKPVELVSFFAYEDYFRGGANVGWGDTNGDGIADIVTGAGAGGGPRVRVFRGNTGPFAWDQPSLHDFFGYDPVFRGGANAN